MDKVTFLRPQDAKAEKNYQDVLAKLDLVRKLFEEHKLRSVVIIGLEDVQDDPEIETEIHRTWAASTVVNQMALLGVLGVVRDEMSEQVRSLASAD